MSPLALLLPLLVLAGSQARPPADALAREQYQMVTAPSALPPELQSALARHLGQEHLHVAAADEPFAITDVVMDPSLPGRRLVAAAVGKKYAVLHYEQGGIALTRHVVVFERGPGRAAEIWSGTLRKIYEPPAEFERALHDGTLWEKPPVSR
jgi:hypothetical protein